MRIGKNSSEKLLEEITKLNSVQFLGVCRILGVELYRKNDEGAPLTEENIDVRDFSEIWNDLCDTIDSMNRTRRRNLGKLIYAATEGKEEKE